jgi:hypothetical protein
MSRAKLVPCTLHAAQRKKRVERPVVISGKLWRLESHSAVKGGHLWLFCGGLDYHISMIIELMWIRAVLDDIAGEGNLRRASKTAKP